jgi:hypothetical protein
VLTVRIYLLCLLCTCCAFTQNLHLVNAQLRKNKEIINHERDSTEINDILNAVDIVGRDPQLVR